MGATPGTDTVDEGFTRFSEEHAQGQLVPRIVEVALACADTVLVADGVDRLTGSTLLQRAALVRAAVLAHHAGHDPRETPVAVLRGHDVGAVAAVVGVIAAGHPVVVLDPTTPAARLRHYVEAAGATLVVSDAERAATAREVAATVLDPDGPGAAHRPDHVEAAAALLGSPADPDDVAVIVYTSGSTGAPKGVACEHRSILHDTWVSSEATGAYPVGSVVAHLLPMAFSAGVTPTLGALLVGARQELFDPRRRSVAELPGFLREVGADVLLASPAILRGVIASLGPQGRVPGLKTVTMAGETVHGAELAAVRRAVGPDCVVRNRYGSTETWLMTEYAISGDDEAPEGATPVGWAVPGAKLQVELADGTLADAGTGRVVLTSRWLGARYWRDPAKTAEVFTDNPDGSRTFRTSDVGSLGADGCLRLLGRSDHSVKVRGLLVEPGEVDALLFAQPDVREALVVGRPSARTGRMSLVAYVVPEGPRPQASAVRAVVRENLPAHMVPEHVVFLDALPRTERGKLDRSRLPEPPRSTAPFEAPRTGWEEVVFEQFCAVLELEDLSIHDDFFELGGDSLAAEALVSRIEALGDQAVGQVGTAVLASAPTVASFAAAVRSKVRSDRPTLVPLRPEGEDRPLFLVAGAGSAALALRTLAQRIAPGIPVLGLQAHGLENRALPDWSVERIARRHVATVREQQPQGPYRVAGHSLGGLVALEMAHQLRRAGQEVEILVVLDSFPPDPALMPVPRYPSRVAKLKEGVSLALTGIKAHSGLGHYIRFFRQGMFLQRRYTTEAYPGPALVVVAGDDVDAGARRQWAPHLSGEARVVEVAGEHMSILREPRVGPVADLVSQALRAEAPAVVDVREGRFAER
ncbi:AMP-dependent synthetase and ligase [Kineococcus radiotolerans SRS30216 = ATCC BAA-149]|uniref:AMP-dependent synthetase and ligase n=1 Tax=Kineococcus radiotolerans (strain ATCC BAA-149 / DSM 14245 / SRS30216) TaxID=266940 RepID=A6WCR2_KINRD|nr:AMP-dependent synthetase and ligase [Kineococcus radiotolerans SRS30216 = ATCC BAA-149]